MCDSFVVSMLLRCSLSACPLVYLLIQSSVVCGAMTAFRQLGTGPGGFYTPSYGYGRVMHLRMMCLGLHWEPRTHR